MHEAPISHAPDFKSHSFDSTMSPNGLGPLQTDDGILVPAAKVSVGELQIEQRGDFALITMTMPGGGIYYAYTPDGARRLADWLHQSADIIDARVAETAREMLLRAQNKGDGTHD